MTTNLQGRKVKISKTSKEEGKRVYVAQSMLLTRFEQNGHSAWVEVDAMFGVMCHVTRSSHEAAPGGGGLLATLLPDTGRDALLHIMCLQCLSSKSSESCRISSDMSAFLITAFGSPRSRG